MYLYAHACVRACVRACLFFYIPRSYFYKQTQEGELCIGALIFTLSHIWFHFCEAIYPVKARLNGENILALDGTGFLFFPRPIRVSLGKIQNGSAPMFNLLKTNPIFAQKPIEKKKENKKQKKSPQGDRFTRYQTPILTINIPLFRFYYGYAYLQILDKYCTALSG